MLNVNKISKREKEPSIKKIVGSFSIVRTKYFKHLTKCSGKAFEIIHIEGSPMKSQTAMKRLMSLIHEISQAPDLFVKNPGRDFTHNRKLPLEAMLKLLISVGSDTLAKELLAIHKFSSGRATISFMLCLKFLLIWPWCKI